MIKYLSPTSFKLFEANPEEFYKIYICKSGDRTPQNSYMALGSGFDALVKSYMYGKLVGNKATFEEAKRFDKDLLFDAQVSYEPKSEIRDKSDKVFAWYQSTGALADILLEMEDMIGRPRFEFEITSKIEGSEHLDESISFNESNNHGHLIEANVSGIPLSGRPDLYYRNKYDANVIHDWKVSSKGSPRPGYVRCRPINTCHRDALPTKYKGLVINSAVYAEDCFQDWTDQLTIYAWLLGVPIGGDIIISVDQLCIEQNRIAAHRVRVSEKYQKRLYNRLYKAWTIINSDYFFRDMSYEDSKARCEVLKQRIVSTGNETMDKLFR